MKKNKRFSLGFIIYNKRIQKALIGICTFSVLFLVCSICTIPKKYDLKVGEISPTDIKAPRDFKDEISTRKKTEEAISNVQLQYNKNHDIQRNAINKLNEYLGQINELKQINLDFDEKVSKLADESKIKLSNEDYIASLRLKDDDITNFEEVIKSAIDKVYSINIKEDDEEDLKVAQDDWNYLIRNTTLSKQLKELAINMGIDLIKPNLFYDEDRTEELKNIVRRQVEPVIIKRSQNIILKGEVVGEHNIYLMQQAGILNSGPRLDIIIYLSLASMVLLTLFIVVVFLYKYKKKILEKNSRLLTLSIILCVSVVLNAAISSISGYLIPTALMVILTTLIFDTKVAFFVSISSILVVACSTSFNIEILLLYIIGCISGSLFSDNVYQRNNIFKGGLLIGLINGIAVLSIGFISSTSIITNSLNALYSIIGGALSSIFAIGMLPLFESMFDIITPIKLLELSNPNQPLIKKLLFEAPGTYHHSILVGNLAETAADEIWASPLLARVGAYYHDIGKTKRPYFFKENQITNDNPHDKITPKLSTAIITSHVKDGVEIASEYKVPGAIKKIIAEHHGTTLVKYFYVMAVNEGNNDDTIKEESFRYEGPKPSSKESAIVMLADSTEAAVRALAAPTIKDIQRMIGKIIDEKVADGQLDNCDLTLKDIEKIKKAFSNVLVGITHTRIEYPELKDNSIQGEKEN